MIAKNVLDITNQELSNSSSIQPNLLSTSKQRSPINEIRHIDSDVDNTSLNVTYINNQDSSNSSFISSSSKKESPVNEKIHIDSIVDNTSLNALNIDYQDSSNASFILPDLALASNESSPVYKKRHIDSEVVIETYKNVPNLNEQKSLVNKKKYIHLEDDLAFLDIVKINAFQDEDMCFLRSILPDLKSMTSTQKRRFKIEVLQLSGKILNELTECNNKSM